MTNTTTVEPASPATTGDAGGTDGTHSRLVKAMKDFKAALVASDETQEAWPKVGIARQQAVQARTEAIHRREVADHTYTTVQVSAHRYAQLLDSVNKMVNNHARLGMDTGDALKAAAIAGDEDGVLKATGEIFAAEAKREALSAEIHAIYKHLDALLDMHLSEKCGTWGSILHLDEYQRVAGQKRNEANSAVGHAKAELERIDAEGRAMLDTYQSARSTLSAANIELVAAAKARYQEVNGMALTDITPSTAAAKAHHQEVNGK